MDISLQQQLPQGYYLSDASCMPHDLLWSVIDEIAWQGDIAVACPDDAILHGVILDGEHRVVGASWSDAPSDTFNFHVAVLNTHQGVGLGSLLIDLALKAYHKTVTFNKIPLQVCVVHEKMCTALKNRGMKIIPGSDSSPGYFRVYMAY